MKKTPSFCLAGVVLSCLSSIATCHAEGLSATPYRPTVSNPADLSAPHHFEIETGWLKADNADSTSHIGLPWLLKYAFTDRFGLSLGGEAVAWDKDAIGTRLSGNGDSTATLKFKFPYSDSAAFGLETTMKIPTAKNTMGTGKVDYTLNGIYSLDVDEWHADVNLNHTQLGVADTGLSSSQYGWAAALSHPLTENLGWAAEFSGVSQHGAPDTSQFLAALSYSLTPAFVQYGDCPPPTARCSWDLHCCLNEVQV